MYFHYNPYRPAPRGPKGDLVETRFPAGATAQKGQMRGISARAVAAQSRSRGRPTRTKSTKR